MIVRVWRGWTRPEDALAYAEYINGTGIVEYKATQGNPGAYIVSRPDGDRTEFLTISIRTVVLRSSPSLEMTSTGPSSTARMTATSSTA